MFIIPAKAMHRDNDASDGFYDPMSPSECCRLVFLESIRTTVVCASLLSANMMFVAAASMSLQREEANIYREPINAPRRLSLRGLVAVSGCIFTVSMLLLGKLKQRIKYRCLARHHR